MGMKHSSVEKAKLHANPRPPKQAFASRICLFEVYIALTQGSISTAGPVEHVGVVFFDNRTHQQGPYCSQLLLCESDSRRLAASGSTVRLSF